MPNKSDEHDHFSARTRRLVAFQEAHPDLIEALSMWIADRSTCEVLFPEAVEFLKREMSDFASDA
jgi:hypothetical protein